MKRSKPSARVRLSVSLSVAQARQLQQFARDLDMSVNHLVEGLLDFASWENFREAVEEGEIE